MFNRARKSLIVVIISLSLLLSACGWVDKTVSNGIDTGFGNKQPCSGIVCP